jgi:hypothetical protein
MVVGWKHHLGGDDSLSRCLALFILFRCSNVFLGASARPADEDDEPYYESLKIASF